MLYELVEASVADLDIVLAPAELTAVSQLLLQLPASRLVQLQMQGVDSNALRHEALQLGSVPMMLAKMLKTHATLLSQILRAGGYVGRSLDPFARLGVTMVLCHLVRPSGPLAHDLPGRYGYLDDFLYVNFAVVEYVGWTPSPTEFENIRHNSEAATGLLAVPIALAINAVMAQSHAELTMLRQGYAHLADEVNRAADALIASPQPQPFLALQTLPPPNQPDLGGRPGGGWTSRSDGSASIIFPGGSYHRFSDGSSVGMVGDKIVGGG
jgi:hypothetical protein